MSDGIEVQGTSTEAQRTYREMLRRVRAADPGADADAVRRYALEIDEAEAVLQTLTIDPIENPLDVSFSPDWTVERQS